MLGEITRMRRTIKVVSLLQPSPETVALFDEIILLDKGRILFAGPVEDVIRHFESLGYKQPERMDPADWLQVSILLSNVVIISTNLSRSHSSIQTVLYLAIRIVSSNKGRCPISHIQRRNWSLYK